MTPRLNRVKVALAVFGFCLAVGGVVLDYRPLVWTAIVSLAAALALRLYLRRDTMNTRSEEPASPRDT